LRGEENTMVRTTLAYALILGFGATGCMGSLDDMAAHQQSGALGATDVHYKHLDLPGTCDAFEFDTLTLRADGAYRAKLANGTQESGTYERSAAELNLTIGDATRAYDLEGDEWAIQLTHDGCSEVLEATEEDATDPRTPSEPTLDPACAERSGGALVTFDVHGERLRVWTTNAEFVARARELIDNHDFHPTPMFERVIAGYDACSGRQWSVDPERVGFSDFATEVCDAMPSYIDANRDGWIKAPGSYCPWGPRVVSVDQR
jgi:hypothetical protein